MLVKSYFWFLLPSVLLCEKLVLETCSDRDRLHVCWIPRIGTISMGYDIESSVPSN